MEKEEVQQLINEAINQLSISSLTCPYHRHTTTDVGQLNAGESLIGAPQSAITPFVNTSAGATYNTIEQNLLNNTATRVNEIYTRLQNLNLLK